MHTRTPTTPPSTSLHHGATRTVWIAVVALLLLSGSTSAMAQDRGTLPYVPTQTIAHANLTVVPLHHRNPGKMPQGQFLTFDEATKAKVVRVTELDGNTSDAEVNAVHVSNLGDKPIFIMSGEVILGGKQDRIIAQNTIVAPNAQQVTVQVFCVEQGRWDGQTAKFASGGLCDARDHRAVLGGNVSLNRQLHHALHLASRVVERLMPCRNRLGGAVNLARDLGQDRHSGHQCPD
ncbi:MAG: DUF6569 family protein [Myxococcota bacterium]